MTLLALTLVVAAAFGHATWNFLAKRAGGGAQFVWLFSGLASAFYAPVAAGVLALQKPALGRASLVFMAGSAVLHLAYFVLLQRGYRVGDLSIVYPIARSTGPALAIGAGIALFDEQPSTTALLGACLVVFGAFVMSWNGVRRAARLRSSVAYGLLVGTVIGSYTLWDKYAVSTLKVPPVLLDWAANLGRAALLTPCALWRWDRVRAEWRANRFEAVSIAVLAPLSYILVLTAMAFTPVSYVAPAREVSMLIGTFLGSRLLGEGHTGQRLAAAGIMVAGLIVLAAS